MSERISDESREGDKRVNRGVLVALGVLVFVIVLVMISALVEPGRLSANEIAEQYVRDNTDALGEEIAAYLVSEYPPIKELAGEFIEDRIEQVVTWEYSPARSLGDSVYAVTATASVGIELDVGLVRGSVVGALPFDLRVDEDEQAVVGSTARTPAASFEIDLPGIGAATTVGEAASGVVGAITEPGVTGSRASEDTSEQSSAVDPQVREPNDARFPIPTKAECVGEARENDSIDSIRLNTIVNTDPNTLIDRERFAWYQFFARERDDLQVACTVFWSEGITTRNGDNRNDDYGQMSNGDGCVDRVVERIRNTRTDLDPDRAAWIETVTLLERPYLSLNLAERFVLREELDGFDVCRAYYPQLFIGRWIPLFDDN